MKRALWAISARPPSVPFELVVCDDGSTEDILGELRRFTCIPWTFIRFDEKSFFEETGLRKFFNNPCVSQNIAFSLSRGDWIFQAGNEVIPFADALEQMYQKRDEHKLLFSTTYDIPRHYLQLLDEYGCNIDKRLVDACGEWPLQDKNYPSDVTNYLSLCHCSLWDTISGFDERYIGGIGAEDSDFVRRARWSGFQTEISTAISLHQSHRGKTRYYSPPPSVITQARWDEGVANNRVIYDAWKADRATPAISWEWGMVGIGEVIRNGT